MHISCLFQTRGNEIELESAIGESQSEIDALEMSPKDSGSSLIRRRSTRKSIREPQGQERNLSTKEALVWKRVQSYGFNPPAVAPLLWWARARVGVGARKGYPESCGPIPQSGLQTKISTL